MSLMTSACSMQGCNILVGDKTPCWGQMLKAAIGEGWLGPERIKYTHTVHGLGYCPRYAHAQLKAWTTFRTKPTTSTIPSNALSRSGWDMNSKILLCRKSKLQYINIQFMWVLRWGTNRDRSLPSMWVSCLLEVNKAWQKGVYTLGSYVIGLLCARITW